MLPFISLKSLKQNGILGMNARNVEFIGKYNERSLYPLVDNKLKTKRLAQEAGISTPNLFFTLSRQYDVSILQEKIAGLDAFVIKPSRGSGGKGILVIKSRIDDKFVKANGDLIGVDVLKRHVTNILAGLYSLGGNQDVAIFEDLIIADALLKGYSFQGVPDIRIIIFRGYPVMAMLRLSTQSSDGKANLHQGAVGVGINLKTAKASYAVLKQSRILVHPDTKNVLDQIEIANWRELLILASKCYDMTKLGYLGVDIVIDEKRGPMLLELNARPGLSIQVANSKGLLPRLREIEKIKEIDPDAKNRVDFVLKQDWF
jgi:alpha-L-glutamate ligase-like protein